MTAKNKKCTSCGREDQPWFSKKRCKGCACIEDRKPLKRGFVIKKQTEKNKVYRKSQSAVRDIYFSYHIVNCRSSEHSGIVIHNPGRSNCCHLFSKSKHPSVQDNLVNCIYLTLQEHTDFDRLLFENDFEGLEKKMPNAWATAKGRMQLLLPFVKEETKFKHKFEEWTQSKQ